MIHRFLTLISRSFYLAAWALVVTAPLASAQTTLNSDQHNFANQDPEQLFSMPRVTEQLQIISAALTMKRFKSAKKGLLRLARQYPWHMESHYLLATLFAVQGKPDQALDFLETAIELGFSNQALLYKDKNLAPLRTKHRFQQLAERLITNPKTSTAKKAKRKRASLVREQTALITVDNTIWDSRTQLLKSYFKFNDRKAVSAKVQKSGDAAAKILNDLFKRGLAAGNIGDVYDNRDRAHSTLNPKSYPQLAFTEYSAISKGLDIDYGLNTKIAFSGNTFGNTSTAISSGPFWRSQARLAYTVPGGPKKLFLQYMNNQLYVLPAVRDFGVKGDLLPTNTPYLILSEGESGSDIPFLRAVATILAAFKPAEKDLLSKSGKLMPAVQMIFRRGQKRVENNSDYLSALAHPVVFRKENIDLLKMVKLANDLKANEFPSIVQMRVIAESRLRPGIDNFTQNLPEQLFNTPASIARIVRYSAYSKSLEIQAHSAVKDPAQNITYKWIILQGDKRKINVRLQNKSGSKVTITSAWHDKFSIDGRPEIKSNRVEIAVFADNGNQLSAPSFITLLYPDHQRRVYDKDGKILSIDHMSQTNQYADPQMFTDRDWKDSFSYDDHGQLMGWVRTRKSGETEFTRHGAKVIEKDEMGRAIKAEHIGYQYSRDKSGQMRATEKPLGSFLEYQYLTDEDMLGILVKQ
ncbi:MAG: hypothetical protein JKY04_00835 [Sneathiella sp.]|nr:hypothetical protein [Sneathiella sp.]